VCQQPALTAHTPPSPLRCRAPEDCPREVLALVQRCLAASPSERPTAAEAVRVLAASLAEQEEQGAHL
jgi:hypothetical protein